MNYKFGLNGWLLMELGYIPMKILSPSQVCNSISLLWGLICLRHKDAPNGCSIIQAAPLPLIRVAIWKQVSVPNTTWCLGPELRTQVLLDPDHATLGTSTK